MDASFCKNRCMVCCEKLCIFFFFPNMQVGVRTFLSKWVKFLAYTTLKIKILAFNNSFYYTPNTKHQTPNILYFLPFHLNIFFYYFFFLQLYFSLSSSLSLSTQQIWPSKHSKPIPTPSTTTGKQHQQPIPTYLSNKLTLFHLNPANPYPSQPPPLGEKKNH